MLCNKCHQAAPREGDTWCIPCSAWESVAVGLGGKWVAGGLREAAAEAVVGTARLVRSLRNLDVGLVAQSKALAAKPREAKEHPPEVKSERPRSPLARARSSSAFAPPVAREEESDYTYVEEESEEEEAVDKGPLEERKKEPEKGRLRPPEPKDPPKVKKEEKNTEQESAKRKHPSERETAHRGRRDGRGERNPAGSNRRRKRHRGGRKHKRLHRAITVPGTRLHRSLPQEFWDQDISRRSHQSPHRG